MPPCNWRLGDARQASKVCAPFPGTRDSYRVRPRTGNTSGRIYDNSPTDRKPTADTYLFNDTITIRIRGYDALFFNSLTGCLINGLECTARAPSRAPDLLGGS